MQLGIHDSTIEYLDKILNQRQQMQKEIKTVQSMKYRKIGLTQIALTDAERKAMSKNTMKIFNSEGSKIYEELNQERQNKGLPELINPFMKGN